MNAFWLNVLFTAVRQILTPELFAQILKLVQLQMDTNLTGPEKKAAVLAQIKEIEGGLSARAKSFASWFLGMAVDVIVAKVNVDLGKTITVA